MPEARLILRTRNAVHGGVVEMIVWSVPSPVPPSQHAFKYRLVFVRDGQRLVGYDNERGKWITSTSAGGSSSTASPTSTRW